MILKLIILIDKKIYNDFQIIYFKFAKNNITDIIFQHIKDEYIVVNYQQIIIQYFLMELKQ